MSVDADRARELQILTRQLLLRQNRSQRGMAVILHEEVVQDLLFVRHLLYDTLENFVPKKIEGALDELLRIVNDLRSLSYQLNPPALSSDDLQEVLEECAVTFEKRHEMPIAFQVNGGDSGVVVPEESRAALFHIFQESLDNAWKHAQAQQIQASLDLQANRVRLEVRDDGVGFKVPASLATWIEQGKLGLASMRERAAGVGGTFHLESRPGRGALVSVDVPLLVP